MLTFKKYSSIENSFDGAFMEKVRNHTPFDARFVVQEKVHGSNCSFLCDGQQIQFAKRTAVIAEGEDFYQWQAVLLQKRAVLSHLQRSDEGVDSELEREQ